MSQLVRLIEKWEIFISQNPGADLTAFAQWIVGEEKKQQSGIKTDETGNRQEARFTATDDKFNEYETNHKISMQAGHLIGKMNQYLLYYSKPIMKNFGLHSMDDFGYLQYILYNGVITKTKVCELMMQEITTGVDILKRLTGHGFIKEKINEADKREKLLQITPKGQKALSDIVTAFGQLPDVLGDIEDSERKTLLALLMQLDEYHHTLIKKTAKNK
jgi:DNA-binding MarR family transcriptional regulator